MKKIIIPTDFTVRSLSLIKEVVKTNIDDDKVDILLVHAVHLPSSITELLFYSKSKLIRSITSNKFEDAISILKNKYASKINSIEVDIYSGYTKSAFKNYIEAKQVEKAYIPSVNILSKVHSKSFNLIPIINKTMDEVVKIEVSSSFTQLKEESYAENALLNLST